MSLEEVRLLARDGRERLAQIREQGLFPRGIRALEAMEHCCPRVNDGRRTIRASFRMMMSMGLKLGPVRRIAPDASGKMGEHP